MRSSISHGGKSRRLTNKTSERKKDPSGAFTAARIQTDRTGQSEQSGLRMCKDLLNVWSVPPSPLLLLFSCFSTSLLPAVITWLYSCKPTSDPSISDLHLHFAPSSLLLSSSHQQEPLSSMTHLGNFKHKTASLFYFLIDYSVSQCVLR